MYLFQKIEELMMTYNDARRSIGAFVIQERTNLYKYTINDIAENTFTSKATVVRFAKALGFDGWKEFMKAFIAEIKYEETHQDDVDANYPFTEKDSPKEIKEKIKSLQIQSIEDTADLLEIEMLEKATNYLLDAKRVFIFGLSPNTFLGELFRRKMITIGKSVEIARTGETGIISRTLSNNDCAILISYSGNNDTTDPTCHLKTLLDNNVPVIGITSGGDNLIRRNLDCVLTISSKERLYSKISNFATEQSIQYILNVLFANYFSKNYENNYKFKLQNSKILETRRIATLNTMKDD